MVNIKGKYGLGVTQALGREGLTLTIAKRVPGRVSLGRTVVVRDANFRLQTTYKKKQQCMHNGDSQCAGRRGSDGNYGKLESPHFV